MTTAERVLEIARAEIGYIERSGNRTKYGQWYGLDGQPWCAMFVSYCFAQAGLPLPASTRKGFAYTPAGAAWFKRNGAWRPTMSADVQPGDVVFFYWPNMGRIAHVGIVEKVVEDGSLVTIEGNTDVVGGRSGGRVMRRVRSRVTVHRNGGFGVPAFNQEEDAAFNQEEEEMGIFKDKDDFKGTMRDVLDEKVDDKVHPHGLRWYVRRAWKGLYKDDESEPSGYAEHLNLLTAAQENDHELLVKIAKHVGVPESEI